MVDVIEIPAELVRFKLPDAVQLRLQHLLDKQEAGVVPLTPEERQEAEGLVDLAEFLSLLQLRSRRTGRHLP